MSEESEVIEEEVVVVEKDGSEERIIVCSGYFDPLHVGHLENLELAKKLGGKLIVIVNSDEQAIMKKGFVFMPQEERMKIVKALEYVDDVVLSIDKDRSICKPRTPGLPTVHAESDFLSAKE